MVFPYVFRLISICDLGMPPPICAKCRQSEALEGDTWCLACSSWDALGRELSGHWDVPGARILAADLVVSCVRQIRGLRGSAGLVRQAVPAVVSGGDRETRPSSPVATTPKAAPASGKRPLPAPPPPPKPVKGESYSEEEEEGEEEVEEESPSPSHRPLGGAGDRRPPEPDHPPSTLTRTSQ